LINALQLLDSREVLHISLPQELPMLHEIRARVHEPRVCKLAWSITC